VFVVQLNKDHFFFAVWTLQGIIAHRKQEMLAPGVEIKDDPVLGFMDSLVKFIIDFTVSCIKPIVTRHLKIFFRDVLDKQLDKINRRKGL